MRVFSTEPPRKKKSYKNMIEMRQSMRIPQDHILHLKVPNLPKGEEVEVLILSKNGTNYPEKVAKLAEAARDPLYLEDMNAVAADFAFADSEHI
jgi:hypothetical protein